MENADLTTESQPHLHAVPQDGVLHFISAFLLTKIFIGLETRSYYDFYANLPQCRDSGLDHQALLKREVSNTALG